MWFILYKVILKCVANILFKNVIIRKYIYMENKMLT